MLAAKQDGVPVSDQGRYTGPGNILTVATNADPNKQMAEVFQFQIEKLGFKLNMRLVPRNTELTRFCDRPASKVAICPTVGWFKDFTDPQSMLDATVQRRPDPRAGQLELAAARRARDQPGDGGRVRAAGRQGP
jgi:ABC-type transport system substrate-binding protein